MRRRSGREVQSNSLVIRMRLARKRMMREVEIGFRFLGLIKKRKIEKNASRSAIRLAQKKMLLLKEKKSRRERRRWLRTVLVPNMLPGLKTK